MDESDRRPVPDPTLLTNQALALGLANLKELFETRIDALAALQEEKFFSVGRQLDLAERQRVEQKTDTAAAVDAALAAAKEAVAKAEVNTAKQLEDLRTNFDTEMRSLRREVGDVGTTATTTRGEKVGAMEGRTGIYAAAGFIATVLLIASIILAVKR